LVKVLALSALVVLWRGWLVVVLPVLRRVLILRLLVLWHLVLGKQVALLAALVGRRLVLLVVLLVGRYMALAKTGRLRVLLRALWVGLLVSRWCAVALLLLVALAVWPVGLWGVLVQ
jgi:hypothetical protein